MRVFCGSGLAVMQTMTSWWGDETLLETKNEPLFGLTDIDFDLSEESAFMSEHLSLSLLIC